jgi:hypothetical protein
VDGAFREWQEGTSERRDERLGLRTERVLRVGDRLWIQNADGDVREVQGIVARRQVTADFIDSPALIEHSEYVHYVDEAKLQDGRTVYELRVEPPDGEPYTIGIDTATWLIDRESYVDHDSPVTSTYSDYHVIDGMLVPYTEIQSNGDAAYDVTFRVTHVTVDPTIDPSIFEPLRPFVVDADQPVTVPLEVIEGHPVISVSMAGKSYRFLVDSGSQSNVIDTSVAKDLGVVPEGTFEVSGAARTSSLGLVEIPEMSVGSARFGPQVATVLDMSGVVHDRHIVGVLGYPFFAAAELRLDPDRAQLIVAKPGSLVNRVSRIDVDTDRELAEIDARVENASTRLLVDTGDNEELLIFQSFVDQHPGLIDFAGKPLVRNSGVGGTTDAAFAYVTEIDLGTTRMYNRYTDVMLASRGAFADKNDGGNVGYATLRNFIMTFDLANRALYLEPARDFDNGRFRRIPDSNSSDNNPPLRGDRIARSSIHDDAADRVQHTLGASGGDRPTVAFPSLVFGASRRADAAAQAGSACRGNAGAGFAFDIYSRADYGCAQRGTRGTGASRA